MRIFLSYSSADRETADALAVALTGQGHEVFFDHQSLRGGDDYNSRLRKEVARSDAFVFLVSPDSVRHGGYCLTELQWARERWPHPGDHLLPVMVRPTDYADMPAYLKSVTVMSPEGNLVAEVLGHFAAQRSSRPRIAAVGGVLIVLFVGLLVGAWAVQYFKEPGDVTVLRPEELGTKDAVAPPVLPPPGLSVDFEVSRLRGARLTVGSAGEETVMLRELALEWDYQPCLQRSPPRLGAPVVEYDYDVELTAARGTSYLDRATYRYGPSLAAEMFRARLILPRAEGRWEVWMSFDHLVSGVPGWSGYETRRGLIEKCPDR